MSIKERIYATLAAIHALAVVIGMFISEFVMQPRGMCLEGAVAPNGGVYMGSWCEPRWFATTLVMGFIGTALWTWALFEGLRNVLKWLAITAFVMLWVLLLATDGNIVTGWR